MSKSQELLNSITSIEGKIHDLEFELELLEKDRVYVSALKTGKNSVMSAYGYASYEKVCDKIVDLKYEIESKIVELSDTRHNAISLIQSIDNSVYSRLLFLRYIKKLPFSRISEELGYSEAHVYKLHKNALKALAARV